MPRPAHHVFVCQNRRDPDNPRGSCMARGAEPLVKAFKEAFKAAGLRESAAVEHSSCLDSCAWGPVVVIHPANVWYGKVTPEDVPAIVAAHARGEALERLRIPEEAILRS